MMLKGFRIATTVARYHWLLRNPRSRALLPTINRQLASPYSTSLASQSVQQTHRTTSKPPRSGQPLTWVIDSKYDTFQRNEEADMLLSNLVNQHYDLKIGDNVMDAEKDQHYEIVRKLGSGDKATTWLARHILSDSSKGDYVALKVMTAYATACSLQTGKYVTHPSSLVRESSSKHSGARHCASIKHAFLAQAPVEQHLCLVMDPLGSTLDELARVQPNGSFPPHVVKGIIKQLILALDYLHRESGVIHGVQSSDIGIWIPTDNNEITEFLKASLAENDPIRRPASVAMETFSTVKSQPLPNFGLEPDLSNLSVRLMDYGLDIDTVKARTYGSDMIVFSTSSIRAPEIMLRGTLTPAIDIWSIGNLTYLYATGRPLFSEHIAQIGPNGRWKDPAVDSLAELTELLGPFPFLFLEKCALRDRYFEADGELLQPSEGQRSLEDDVRRYSDLEERDVKALTSFIRRCLALDPSERATLHELQSHEWLR